MVGVDFSEASRQALAHAFRLARRLEAQVDVVYVAGAYDPALPFSRVNRAAVRELRRVETERAREALARLVQRSPVPARTKVLFGRPSDRLLAHAARVRAELLVLGSVGHGVVENLFIGSTAQRVAQRAPIPVLLVPRHRRAPARSRTGPRSSGRR